MKISTSPFTVSCPFCNHIPKLNQSFILAGPRVTFPEDDHIFVMNVSSDINVSCTAIAFPPPIIEFYYNGSLLDQTEQKIYISTSVLVGNEISRT